MRLFLAAAPPPAVVARLDAGLDASGLRASPSIRWSPSEQWHVTLRFWPDAALDAVLDALAALDSPPVTASLGNRLELLGGSALVVPVAGLDRLAAAVAEVTGPAEERRRFRGHLTLGRLRRGASCPPLEDPSVSSFGGSFEVTDLQLVASTLTADGAIHERLARYELRRTPG